MRNPSRWSWLALLGSVMLAAGAAAAAETTRVSVSSSGLQGNNQSTDAVIASDGRYVVFVSRATNLVAGDANGFDDIFVHDRETGSTTLASVSSSGTAGNRESREPSLSVDGGSVVFTSFADNLVAGDSNGAADVFLRNLQSGTTARVSVSSGGQQGNAFSGSPAISANGAVVAFAADASNLVSGDTNGVRDVFLRDLVAGVTTRASIASNGAQANDTSSRPALSGDGRYVAFQSAASNLVAGDGNGVGDVFVHDRQTGATTRVSISSTGAEGNGSSRAPAISADGRYVAFESGASNLVSGDANGVQDVFVHDRQSGVTTLVSVTTGGQLANGDSSAPGLSADGLYVAFDSVASNLVANDANGVADVFLREIAGAATTRVSVATSGAEGNAASRGASVSANGQLVAFESSASNLVTGDSNGADDAFVRDRQTGAEPSSLLSSLLPSSRAVQVGAQATVFATIINTGAEVATECGIALIDGALGTFFYQTTDPETNLPTGTPDTPVDIPGGIGSQSFVISLTPTREFDAVDVRFLFDCANTTPAPITPGLNTLLLSASASRGLDVVAIAATPTADGILALPGPSGTEAFALAIVNVGVGGNVTVSADDGDAELPLTLLVCATDLAGQCLAPPAPEVTSFLEADATATYSVFGTADGAIALDPASSRVTVRFLDSGGATVGATSVAVTTE